MRQHYIYDVLFERWKDRERKLEDEYHRFPAVNSFPTELRKTEFTLQPLKVKKPGELPSDSKTFQHNKIQAMEEMFPRVPTIDDYAKGKVNMDIFKAETLNKVNSRRLQDLERYERSADPLDRIDN